MNVKSLLAGAVLVASLSGAALAADDGWENNSDYTRHFDHKTIVTVTGTVEKVDRKCIPLKGMEPGFAAIIKTDKGEHVEVQVGPVWFTSFYHHRWNAQIGDRVKVVGSKVTLNGHPAIMAMYGEKGKLKMTVRNPAGAPVWDFPVEGF